MGTELKRDLLQESYSIASHIEGERDADGFPVLRPMPLPEHVKILVGRLDAFARWRVELMERILDDLPAHDLVVRGPSFPKGAD